MALKKKKKKERKKVVVGVWKVKLWNCKSIVCTPHNVKNVNEEMRSVPQGEAAVLKL